MEDNVQTDNLRFEQFPTINFTCEIPLAKADGTDNDLSSATFSFPEGRSTKWRLTYRSKTLGWAEFELSLLSSDFLYSRLKIDFDFLNEKRALLKQMDSISYKFKKPGDHWTSSEFYSQHSSVKNKLILSVQMCLTEHAKTCSVINDNKMAPTTLSEDFRRLLDEGSSGDLDLTAEGKKLKVHKLIMTARSPMLAAVLVEGMDWEEFPVPDVDFEVLERVVRYMYTDEIDIKIETGKVYNVACKYAISGLKFLCEESIEKSLTVENAAETLVFVDKVSKDLKTIVTNFIKSHGKEIMTTKGFQSMLSEHPQLSLEIFCILNEVGPTINAR